MTERLPHRRRCAPPRPGTTSTRGYYNRSSRQARPCPCARRRTRQATRGAGWPRSAARDAFAEGRTEITRYMYDEHGGERVRRWWGGNWNGELPEHALIHESFIHGGGVGAVRLWFFAGAVGILSSFAYFLISAFFLAYSSLTASLYPCKLL